MISIIKDARHDLISRGRHMEIEIAVLMTLYGILLGPLKVLGPFAVTTAKADEQLMRRIAFRAFGLSTGISLLLAVVGGFLMSRLNLSVGTLAITMGAFMGHWAVTNALAPPSQSPPSPPDDPSIAMAVIPITTPAIIPPQGVALLELSSNLEIQAHSHYGLVLVVGVIVGVMLLNLLFMLYHRSLIKFTGAIFWQVLGRLLAVVLSAAALQIILGGCRELGIVP